MVVEVGKAVERSFKPGDRVAGFGHGANDYDPETGSFARFIIVKGDTQMRVPDEVSFEAACTVGCGIATVGFALYNTLHLPLPGAAEKPDMKTILIYGGSTATGTLAIQFARMSGLEVITTCSPKHFGLMKDLGASHVYDYHDPTISAQIKALTNDTLKLVFDTVALDSTAKICAEAIGKDGGVYCNLLDVHCPREDVRSEFFLAYSQSGEAFIYEREYFEAQPEHFAFAAGFADVAERLWQEGKWKAHPRRVERGGLSGVSDGLQQMRDGKVSGEKLVYLVEETEWPVLG